MNKHDNPCFKKAGENEPIFVIRAKDVLAVSTILHWCSLAHIHGIHQDKVDDALRVAKEMATWQQSNGTKLPD